MKMVEILSYSKKQNGINKRNTILHNEKKTEKNKNPNHHWCGPHNTFWVKIGEKEEPATKHCYGYASARVLKSNVKN